MNYPGTNEWWTLAPAPSSDKPSGAFSGAGAVMMERVECVVKLRTEVKSLAVFPLDGCGKRMANLNGKEVTKEDGTMRIHLAGETSVVRDRREVTRA